MKVNYEFMVDIQDEYEDLKIFQRSMEMYSALVEIKCYLTTLKNDEPTNEVENIIENIFDLIWDADIGEI